MSHATRESWLSAAVEALRPVYAGQKKPLPEKLRVSCGWPSKGATAEKTRRMGECWNPDQSGDNTVEVFISPLNADAVSALDVLAHELVHAALFADGKPRHGHNKQFQALARGIGLEEPWKCASAGPTFRAVLVSLAETLGPYPFSPLHPSTPQKKQTTRMVKCSCSECGYTVRTTQKWLSKAVPSCPVDETLMTVEGGTDGQESTGEGEEGGTSLEGLAP